MFWGCWWIVVGVGVTWVNAQSQGHQSESGEGVVFRWVNVVEVGGGDGRRVRVWGKASNFSDPSGVNVTFVGFLGVPYALAPTGHLRFQRPSLRILDREFRALTPAPPCPQLDRDGGVIGEEDCLHLNIFMPHPPKGQGGQGQGERKAMPVLIWLHGESPERLEEGRLEPLSSGSAGQIDPGVFMPGGVVVVVPQFRLGTLGFASTVNEDLTGNVGLFDQLLALEWVGRFIVHFGGDPKQVTLLGGSNAGLLATTDLARGLFQRLILMGGSPLGPLSLDPSGKVTYGEIALQNNCPSFPSSHFVRCMQGRRVSSLVNADQRLVKGRGLARLRLPLPLIQKEGDGRFLPPLLFRSPRTTLQEGQEGEASFTPVPVIIGVTAHEMRGFLPGLVGADSAGEVKVLSSEAVLQHFIRSLVTRYPSPFGGEGLDPEASSQLLTFEYFSGLNLTDREEQAWDLLEEMLGDLLFTVPALSLAQLWSKHGPVYFYLFDHGDKANHGSDVEFLMRGHTGATGQDRELSAIMVELWRSFLHQGSPLGAGIEWPEWRKASGRQILLLSGDEVGVVGGLRQRQFHLWANILPVLASASGSKCPPKTGSLSILGGGGSGRSYKSLPLFFKDVDEAEVSKKFFTLNKDKLE